MPKKGKSKKGKAGSQENIIEFDGQSTTKIIVDGKVVEKIKVIHKYKLQSKNERDFIRIANAILAGEIEVIE